MRVVYRLLEVSQVAQAAGNHKYRLLKWVDGRFDYRIIDRRSTIEMFDQYLAPSQVSQKVLACHWAT